MAQMTADENAQNSDGINLIELLLDLKKRWKQVFLITLTGTLISVIIAFMLPKYYKQKVVASLPSVTSTVKLNENGLNEYTRLTLLKQYYDKARSVSFFRKFLNENEYLKQLYPELYTDRNSEQLFSRFSKSFQVKVIEPKVENGGFVDSPTRFEVSIEHTNEPLLVEMMNRYLAYTNQELLKQMRNEQTIERDAQITVLKRDIQFLREKEKTKRNLLIEKMLADNIEKLATLEQRKQLLIARENNNRATKIAILEEQNLQQLNELLQKRELMIKKASRDRVTNIALAEEALGIASNLKIVHPTRLDNLDRNDQRASGGTGSSTNISLSTDQELPLYLMGTKYLTALVETLKSRKNDEVFLIELNELDTEIAKARDDQALKTLKARKTSAPFLTEIHEINAEIARIKHDQTLRALQQRSSDDPFIEDLPEKINRASILEELSLQFLDIKAYTIDQAAFETRKPSRPSMRLIVIIGAMLSVIFALLFVSVSVVIDRRDRQGEMSSNYS